MLPLIGITCAGDEEEINFVLRRYYVAAVVRCGGVPIILPAISSKETIKKYAGTIQGLLLSGGGDVDPFYFKEEPRKGTGFIDPERDFFEIYLTREIIALKKPLLAICRGVQILNIVAGGDIYQDLEETGSYLKHQQEAPRWYPTHDVYIESDCMLAEILGCKQMRVNSFHHQAVKKLGNGLRVAARAGDRVVEALEGSGSFFVLGVQWHPECMYQKFKEHLKIFKALVDAAGKLMNKTLHEECPEE